MVSWVFRMENLMKKKRYNEEQDVVTCSPIFLGYSEFSKIRVLSPSPLFGQSLLEKPGLLIFGNELLRRSVIQ